MGGSVRHADERQLGRRLCIKQAVLLLLLLGVHRWSLFMLSERPN